MKSDRLAAVLIAAAFHVAGAQSPAYTPADVKFMQGMIHHHAQAVTMAQWAPTHGAGPAVRTLAERIDVGQHDEINFMRRWLAERHEPAPDPFAAGRGAHEMPDMPGMKAMPGTDTTMLMPGMLTPAQMQQLDAARGAEFDRLFLTFMIQHHRGALQMVKELYASPGAGQEGQIFRFASDVVADQTAEIDRMQHLLSTLPPQGGSDRLLGLWQGALQVSGLRLRLVLDVKRDSSGALSGVLTSLDQNNTKLPATIALHADTLVAEMPMARAVFRGVLTAAGDSLRGTFTQGAPLPLTLGRTNAMPTLNRPQTPKPPFPYRTEDVSVQSSGGARLSCTVDAPSGPGPFPAVVMASGSGPQDRDETLFEHKPFLVLADYLARHGIASLRCDDRGVGRSTGSYATASLSDFADDAQAGVEYLRARPDIAKNKVGIMGHSEGGMIGPMVAARSRDVAFVVMLAGPGVRGDSLLLLQGRAIAAASGAPAAALDQQERVQRALFAAVLASRDSADELARVDAAIDQVVAGTPEAQRAAVRRQLEQSRAQLLTRELTGIVRFDPSVYLRQVHVPVLAIGGTLDLQVPARENLAAIDSLLKLAGDRDVRTVTVRGVNHLLQPATTGAPAEYGEIEETISPEVLQTVAAWINERFAAR